MTLVPDVRKAVLLRLSPELLERVDRAAGRLPRTQWLVDVITRELNALEYEPPVGHMLHGAKRSRPGDRVNVISPDGEDLGLQGTVAEGGEIRF